jgi:L-seryl-tRNA(Ser) seleniumtransferase
LTGAEDALVVNNNAAALLLTLGALARGKQVLVSRGELVEIGGEFRLPDIMSASGARLVEVGTTNRTRVGDFERAATPKTGLILKVHPSNFRIVGFAQSPAVSALAHVAAGAGVPLAYDLGSGLLTRAPGIDAEEPTVADALRDGADLVCFSGDKLLAGPQAGILLGRADLVDRLRRHPLARALRVDKLQVAALEAVLVLHARGEHGSLPTWRAIREPATSIRRRARSMAATIPGATVVKSEATVGGGSVPGQALPSWAVRLPTERPDILSSLLRHGRPSVFCRVDDGEVLLDLRTVPPEAEPDLTRAIRYALAQLSGR